MRDGESETEREIERGTGRGAWGEGDGEREREKIGEVTWQLQSGKSIPSQQLDWQDPFDH